MRSNAALTYRSGICGSVALTISTGSTLASTARSRRRSASSVSSRSVRSIAMPPIAASSPLSCRNGNFTIIQWRRPAGVGSV
jgi:hypothetical protein